MKKQQPLKLIIVASLAAVMASSLLLCASCVPGQAPAVAPSSGELPDEALPEVITLRAQGIYAPAQVRDLMLPWANYVKEASGGRVQIECYGGGEIVPEDQAIQACARGTLDFVVSIPMLWSAPVDTINLDGTSPMAWDTAQDLMVMWEYFGLEEEISSAYNEIEGIRYCSPMPTDPTHLISTRPIEKYEDLVGLKINTYETIARLLEDGGAKSVRLPMEEFYMSGQTGIVDALIWCGAQEAYSNGWHEVYKNFLGNPIGGNALCSWLCNKNMWDSLPADIQAIFNAAWAAARDNSITYYHYGESYSRQFFNVTYFSDEDWAKIQDLQSKYWDEEAQKSERCARIVEIFMEYREFKEKTS